VLGFEYVWEAAQKWLKYIHLSIYIYSQKNKTALELCHSQRVPWVSASCRVNWWRFIHQWCVNLGLPEALPTSPCKPEREDAFFPFYRWENWVCMGEDNTPGSLKDLPSPRKMLSLTLRRPRSYLCWPSRLRVHKAIFPACSLELCTREQTWKGARVTWRGAIRKQRLLGNQVMVPKNPDN
jgi:hypothetical protein